MSAVSEKNNRISVALTEEILLEFPLQDGHLAGLGKVEINGFPLRSESECIFPELATPDGWEIDHYEYCGCETDGEAVVITTKPYFRVSHRMEWSEHALHLRLNTASWSTGPKTVEGACFQWILRPCTEIIAGRSYKGFSYGFRYSCPGRKIYQIEDKATWELGGDIGTNTFVLRGGTDTPISDFSKKESYEISWVMPGIANPYIFQHQALYAQLQGFTFQYDSSRILITKHVHPSHVRTMFRREKGSPLFLHFNQFCFDLTDEVETPAREILLCCCGEESYTDRMNHFLRTREQIQNAYRAYYGVRLDRARPDTHIETWNIAKMENFPAILRQVREWGFPRAFIMPLWRSNTTDVEPRFKEDREDFGILGNMCCPLELEIASCYGGLEGMKKAFSCVKELDMDTYMWFGSHFSSVTNLNSKIHGLFAHDVSGQNQRNNYGHVLWAVDQNNPAYQEYLLNAYLQLKECGILGIFRDSHCNMAVDTINYLHYEKDGVIYDDVRSMHDSELAIQKSFQDNGLLYYVEDLGIFGTPMSGAKYDNIDGYEFLYQDVSAGMDLDAVLAKGESPYEVYFRSIAVRLFYQLHVEVNQYPAAEALDPWWDAEKFVPLLKAYAAVEPYMETMSLLPDGLGIHWEDGKGGNVVFAYKNGEISVPEQTVVKAMIDGIEITSDGTVSLDALEIYYYETNI